MLIDWDALPSAPGMRPGAVRKAIAAEKMSAVRVATAPDASFDGSLHRHDNEQILVMVAGELELKVDDDVFTARPGDMVFFPAGSWHGAIGVGPDGAEYYELFAPARIDQLPGWVGPAPLEYR